MSTFTPWAKPATVGQIVETVEELATIPPGTTLVGNSGLLWCTLDQAWESADLFGVDRSRLRGRAAFVPAFAQRGATSQVRTEAGYPSRDGGTSRREAGMPGERRA